jgi:ATP-dependent helicase HrpA
LGWARSAAECESCLSRRSITGGGARDRQLMLELTPHQQRYDDASAASGVVNESLGAFEEYRWMLEEFRISLFAQQIGTSIKISPQRLEKQWGKV